jgi:hypothetical protein
MDVVLTPAGSEVDVWSLKDRLGRDLGTIAKGSKAGTFRIRPEPGSALQSVKIEHATLDEAMSAIAKLTNGACNLDSQQWD